MAQKRKTCTRQQIVIKHGRKVVVKFTGRPGGKGQCGSIPISAEQRKVRKTFAKANELCKLFDPDTKSGLQRRKLCFRNQLQGRNVKKR